MESNVDVLQKVVSQPLGSKKLDKLAKSTAKNFKLSTQNSLEKANNLAYWLYIYDQKELSLAVCQLLSTVEFADNYNIWTWIETALALEARLLKENKENNLAEKCIERIKEPVNLGDEPVRLAKNKALARRINGELLQFNKIEQAEEENDKQLEIDYRLVQLKELILVNELGGSQVMPLTILEENIELNIKKLRE